MRLIYCQFSEDTSVDGGMHVCLVMRHDPCQTVIGRGSTVWRVGIGQSMLALTMPRGRSSEDRVQPPDHQQGADMADQADRGRHPRLINNGRNDGYIDR